MALATHGRRATCELHSVAYCSCGNTLCGLPSELFLLVTSLLLSCICLHRLGDERLNDVLVRAAAVTPLTVADLVLGQLPVKEADMIMERWKQRKQTVES